jgi:hypothetical protein
VSRKARRVRAAVRAAHHDEPRVLARAAEAAGAWSQRSACLFFRLVPTAAAGCAARAACSTRPAWPRPPRDWVKRDERRSGARQRRRTCRNSCTAQVTLTHLAHNIVSSTRE